MNKIEAGPRILIKELGCNLARRALAIHFLDVIMPLLDPGTRIRFELASQAARQMNVDNRQDLAHGAMAYVQFLREKILQTEPDKVLCFTLWGALPNPDWESEESIADWCYEVLEPCLEDHGVEPAGFYDEALQFGAVLKRMCRQRT